MPPQQPDCFGAWILQVGDIPQGCWSMLTQWHHAVAADWTAVLHRHQPVPLTPDRMGPWTHAAYDSVMLECEK